MLIQMFYSREIKKRKTHALSVGLCLVSLFGAALSSRAEILLQIDFEDGYEIGPLNDQESWKVSEPDVDQVQSDYKLGTKAISGERGATTGGAYVPLIKPLNFEDKNTVTMCLKFDAFRLDNRASAYWTLVNLESGATTGIGVYIPPGEVPIEIITGGSGTENRVTTDFMMPDEVWQRFQLEVDNSTKTVDIFVETLKSDGTPERRQSIAKNLTWSPHNSVVDAFTFMPQNIKAGSPMYTDNISLETDVEFSH